MREAVISSRQVGREPVDQPLGVAAAYGRSPTATPLLRHAGGQAPVRQAGKPRSLQQGLSGWQALGR